MESDVQNPMITSAKGQLFSCFHMLETLVEVCPNKIWQSVYHEVPFWYQVYHTAYFVDYWLREGRTGGGFPSVCFDPHIPSEVEWAPSTDVYLSRATMRVYLRQIRAHLNRIFASLTDCDLSRPASGKEPEVTLLDAIFSQTRHIMYNVGYCNGILREQGSDKADWYANMERNK